MPGPHGRPKGDGITDVEALTNAAISAAMAQERLYGDSPEIGYRDGNTAVVHSDGVLRWPDGHPYDPGYDYTSDWQSWRSAIAAAVEPWEARPTLGPFYDEVEAMKKTAELLRPGVDVTGKDTGSGLESGGRLRDAIISLGEDLAGMEGTTIWKFRTKYVDHLHTVNEAQFGLAFVIGQCVAAEQAIWDKADLDYRELVSQATAAFLAAREYQTFGGGGGDYSTELQVAGAVLSAIGIFASGGLGTAVAVASFAVSTLSDFAPKGSAPKPRISGGTAQEVLDSFTKALGELRDEIARQEDAIRACLQRNLDRVSGSPRLFDLSSPAIDEIDDPAQIGFKVDTNRMRLCGTHTCKRVASGFSMAASAAEAGFGEGPWQRPAYFGSSSGSYPEYAALLDTLTYAARNTAYEIAQAGHIFAATADYFDDSDGNAHQALSRLHRLVAGYQAGYPVKQDHAHPEQPDPATVVDGWAVGMGLTPRAE